MELAHCRRNPGRDVPVLFLVDEYMNKVVFRVLVCPENHLTTPVFEKCPIMKYGFCLIRGSIGNREIVCIRNANRESINNGQGTVSAILQAAWDL